MSKRNQLAEAGLDVGQTRTKLYWESEEGLVNWSELKNAAALANYRRGAADPYRVNVTGLGPLPEIEGIRFIRPEGDLLTSEIVTQARGAAYLMRRQVRPPPEDHLVVSVGTGTSYALVSRSGVTPLLGNALGGGFLAGQFSLMGLTVRQYISAFSEYEEGTPLDTLLSDLLPELSGTPAGRLVAAHFAKANRRSRLEDLLETAVHCVATAVARDLLLFRQYGNCPPTVILVGGVPASMPKFLRYLRGYTDELGLTLLVPNVCEFAGAAGAFIRDK